LGSGIAGSFSLVAIVTSIDLTNSSDLCPYIRPVAYVVS
jgi:hypothetical protein